MRISVSVLLIAVSFALGCATSKVVEFKKFQNDSEVPRITLADAKKDFDAGTAVIVDSRPEPTYKQEHIAGAINIPFGSPDSEYSSKLPKDKKIIVYCS